MEAHGVEVLVQAGAGEGRAASQTRPTGPPGPRSWLRPRGAGRVRDGRQGEGTGLRSLWPWPHALHVPAPRRTRRSRRRSAMLCGTTGIAYETVMRADGALPLLAPMSEVQPGRAGRCPLPRGAAGRAWRPPRPVRRGCSRAVSSSALGTWDGTRRGSQRAGREALLQHVPLRRSQLDHRSEAGRGSCRAG